MPVRIKKHIPNSITSLNLLSGCISIVLAFEGYLIFAVYMIFLAAFFDFLDGMSARILDAYSKVGKELDSLADVISFGVAPSIIVFHMMKVALFKTVHFPPIESLNLTEVIFLLIPFFIAVLSGVRLAKFNVDERQIESFIGLAVPANALFFASIYLVSISTINDFLISSFKNEYILSIVIILFSLLLVSNIPMFSLKFKSLGLKENKIRYIFIVLSLILLILLHTIAVPIIIAIYVLLSAINNWIFNFD